LAEGGRRSEGGSLQVSRGREFVAEDTLNNTSECAY
jgi:hypothetical protein